MVEADERFSVFTRYRVSREDDAHTFLPIESRQAYELKRTHIVILIFARFLAPSILHLEIVWLALEPEGLATPHLVQWDQKALRVYLLESTYANKLLTDFRVLHVLGSSLAVSFDVEVSLTTFEFAGDF